MPNIQVDASRRREIEEFHRLWSRELPRVPGQLGGTITSLVVGPPIHRVNEIITYSDFEQIRFIAVDLRFLEYLKVNNISFLEN
jgi:hypothetical protein